MKFQDLQRIIKTAYFSSSDLRLRKFSIYPYQFSFWMKSNKIGRIKRGIYYFTERKDEIELEEVAHLIYNPSYVSLESALSYYGFIPEKVFTITSVSTKTSRKFKNDFGKFSYRKIKKELFFGYNAVETKNGKYLLAEPEKAVIDYFYLNLGKINNPDDIKELRFNCYELKDSINLEKITKYASVFNIKKLSNAIDLLLKQC